jgi:hypothetical protein
MFEHCRLGLPPDRNQRTAISGRNTRSPHVRLAISLLVPEYLSGIRLTAHLVRPLHNCFPLQGVMSHNSSSADLRVEFKEIHAAAPTGSWARLAQMLTSLSELYIIFERVRLKPPIGNVRLISEILQALLSEPLVILADDPRTASEFVSCVVDLIRPVRIISVVIVILQFLTNAGTIRGRCQAILNHAIR